MASPQRAFLLGVSLLLGACTATEYQAPADYRGPGDVMSLDANQGTITRQTGRGGRGRSSGQNLRAAEQAVTSEYLSSLSAEARSGVPILDEIPLVSLFMSGGQEQEEQEPQDTDRQMIYTASMTVEVARVDDAIERCMATVTLMGGYLSGRTNATLTWRIPAASFENLLDELRDFGRILNESMQARDVTREYVDLGIRLENARRSRERLLALLEQAEQVEDMIKIETELRRLTTEIEQIEGQLKYLGDQVAMSTVSVTFRAVAAPDPNGPRRPSQFRWINLTGAEYVLRWF